MNRLHKDFTKEVCYFIIYTICICLKITFADQKCEKEITNIILIKDSYETRTIIIWYPAVIGTISTYDKCSYTTGEPLQRNCTNVLGKAKWFEINSDNKYVECKQIKRNCENEIFEHQFRDNNSRYEKYANKWQATQMGQVGYLEKPCYINAEHVLTRKCIYNSKEYKAEWKKSNEEKENMICWKEQNPIFAKRQCKHDFLKTSLRISEKVEENVLFIWFPTNAGSYSEQPICNNINGLPLNRHCMLNRSNNIGDWEYINENMEFVNCSSIVKECKEEPFEHNYIKNNYQIISNTNHWKQVNMNEIADLQEPCLNSTGLPLTRRCNFNSKLLKAEWEPLGPEFKNVSCVLDTKEKVITYELNKLYEDSKKTKETETKNAIHILENLTQLLTTPKAVRLPADIKMSSEILKITTEESTSSEILTQVLNVTDIIANTNRETLIKSEKLNVTSNLLNTLDTYLHKTAKVLIPPEQCSNFTDGIFYKIVKRTSVFIINPSCSNISGIAVYKVKENETQNHSHCYRRYHRYDKHTRTCYRFLYLNQSMDQLINEPNIRMATYIPITLWTKLKREIGSINEQTVLMFAIFPNDALFINRTNMEYRPGKNILEIHITDYSGELPENIPFILSYHMKNLGFEQQPRCGYWNYKTWITDGISTEIRNISNNYLLICYSTHLTHVASIFQTSSFPSLPFADTILLNISHEQMLDYISIVGCGLSLMGLACIWLTALCFRNWRHQPSIKVLLNLCFVLTLIMLYFLLLNFPQLRESYMNMKNETQCMVMGGFLHYAILVLFVWMLIVAVMQYQRYVKVVGYDRSSNFVFKYAFAAWGLPLIPTIIVALYDSDTYLPSAEKLENNTGICYPSGNSFYYGALLPMAVVMFMNLIIFIYIFYSIHRSLVQFKEHNDKKHIMTQIRVSVLLFFLLGISWIFGLLMFLTSSSIFAYIFSLTVTLQGFVLFIFSIIIDKSTRNLWMILCCTKSYYTRENDYTITEWRTTSR